MCQSRFSIFPALLPTIVSFAGDILVCKWLQIIKNRNGPNSGSDRAGKCSFVLDEKNSLASGSGFPCGLM